MSRLSQNGSLVATRTRPALRLRQDSSAGVRSRWIGIAFAVAACGPVGDAHAPPWHERRDSSAFTTIENGRARCDSCVVLESVALLGTLDGPGYLEDNGPLDHVVRDGLGRYWVGQRGGVKIFSGTGQFVARVGRRGQGPMEFDFAQPVYLDSTGLMHLADVRMGRETLVTPELTLHSDRRLVDGFDGIAPLPGLGGRYVVSKWIAAPERIGLPLHVFDGSEIIASFGRSPRMDTMAATPASTLRRVAVTPDGYVLSGTLDQYLIEVWTADGQRITGFELPGLNEAAVEPGVWAEDNPPPNLLVDLRMRGERTLVVLTRHRRPNWRELVVERVSRSGVPYLDAIDGHVASVYRSRIDLLDLDVARVVASEWHDGYLLKLLEDDLISSLEYGAEGEPYVRLLRLTIR